MEIGLLLGGLDDIIYLSGLSGLVWEEVKAGWKITLKS